MEVGKLRMEDAYEIVKEPIRMEGGFFVEEALLYVAGMDIVVAPGIELAVAVMVGEQFIVSDIMVSAVTEEPDVGLTAFLQHSLEG